MITDPEGNEIETHKVRVVREWSFRDKHPKQSIFVFGMAVGTTGIYLSELEPNRIRRYTAEGSYILAWDTKEGKEGQSYRPWGVALGIRDGIDGCVLEMVRAVPVLARFPPGLLSICAAYVGQECAYVTDTTNHQVRCFLPNGQFLFRFGRYGNRDAEFMSPTSCAMDPTGNRLYVCDRQGCRIQCFLADTGQFLCGWRFPGTSSGHLCADEHSVYLGAHYIEQCFDGGRSTCFIQPRMPYIYQVCDIVAHGGHLYFLDGIQKILVQCKLDGKIVRVWRGGEIFERVNDANMAIGPDGLLYVSDRFGARILAIDIAPI